MSISFAAIIATARQHTGMTPAQMDFALTQDDGCGFYNAVCALVYAKTGAEFSQICDTPRSDRTAAQEARLREIETQRDAEVKTTMAAIRPQIADMKAAALTKEYVGWSTASRGPIRYAS